MLLHDLSCWCLTGEQFIKNVIASKFFIIIIHLWNFLLYQDLLSSDAPPHLAQPSYVALGSDSGLICFGK